MTPIQNSFYPFGAAHNVVHCIGRKKVHEYVHHSNIRLGIRIDLTIELFCIHK